MTTKLSPSLQTLLDKEAILDRSMAWAWGVDSFDMDLVDSCFAREAMSNILGQTFYGARSIVRKTREDVDRLQATSHYLSNQLVTLHGDRAHVETYGTFVHRAGTPAAGATDTIRGLRIFDEMLRDGTRWVIGNRRVLEIRTRQDSAPGWLPQERRSATRPYVGWDPLPRSLLGWQPGSEEEAVQYLQDRLAIRDLLARYYRGVDTKNFDQVRSTYTPEGWVEYRGDMCEGHDGILGKVRLIRNSLAPTHFNINCLTNIKGNTADGVSYTTEVNVAKRPDGSLVAGASCLTYLDEYVKRGGQWLCHRRITTPFWGTSWKMLATDELTPYPKSLAAGAK